MGQEDQKATWVIIAKLLANEASSEEVRRLEALLKDDPELHYPMQTLIDLWKVSAKADDKEADRAFSRHLERLDRLGADFPAYVQAIDNPRRDGRWNIRRDVLWSASAIVAAVICVIWFAVRPTIPAPATAVSQTAPSLREFHTANGSRTYLTLPDGTRVWLNAGSRLFYDKNFNGTRRDVTLTGEAFFDVARDMQKPFLIHTDRIDIRVLGTSFNVKSYPAEKTTEATLIRGSIEVSVKERPAEKIILKPDQKLIVGTKAGLSQPVKTGRPSTHADLPVINIGKPTYEQRTGTIIETSWVDNKLSFKEENFGDLARQMERWYGITIRFSDPLLVRLEFTGSFKEESIGQALEALKLTAKFSYEINGNQVTIDK